MSMALKERGEAWWQRQWAEDANKQDDAVRPTAGASNIQQFKLEAETARVMSTFTRADASGRPLAGGLALGSAGWHMKTIVLGVWWKYH